MEAQEALNAEQFEGVAGGGMVKVIVTGQREVVEVNLDSSVVDPDDIEMLQDLIVVATNEALKKSRRENKCNNGEIHSRHEPSILGGK